MYKFSININPNEHDEFVKSHNLCSLLQSSSWAKIKDNWDNSIIGVYENDKLVASSLVLIKKLPLSFTMMYIPRGPILDYENHELLNFYFSSIKKWAKKQNCLFIKFDPPIVYKEYLVRDKDSSIPKNNVDNIIANIHNIGGIHMGFTTEMSDTIQPRFHMGLYKVDDLSKHITKEALKSRNAAVRKYVTAKRYGKEKLDSFSNIMISTEDRKGVLLRNKEYFEKLMDVYQDNAYLFIVSVDPQKRFNEVKLEIDNLKDELSKPNLTMKAETRLNRNLLDLQKEYDSLYEIANKYNTEQDIAGALMIGYGDTIEMLYAGMNAEFKAFRPQDYLYYERFNYAFNEGYNYASMGGVEGSLKDGLTIYKSKYNTLVCEYIGEFDFPINSLLYKLSRFAYTIRKKRKL